MTFGNANILQGNMALQFWGTREQSKIKLAFREHQNQQGNTRKILLGTREHGPPPPAPGGPHKFMYLQHSKLDLNIKLRYPNCRDFARNMPVQ